MYDEKQKEARKKWQEEVKAYMELPKWQARVHVGFISLPEIQVAASYKAFLLLWRCSLFCELGPRGFVAVVSS